MSRSGECALFVYGTLRDSAVQEALFGRTIEGEAAILRGWALYCSDSDGFLFVKPNRLDSVCGSVLRLSASELEIADAWEDLPLYRRERVHVTIGSRVNNVWLYTRRDGVGPRHDSSSYSGHNRADVVDWARRVGSRMDVN
ncbi:MAG TPA: gamma-glutamylcyclotransferase family protein [Chloroflexota bacterium]|jgi:gamma-glutamylcyclotransferase (GGCT)/AIG2-like uncharacterized protein YtfP|nr:gamma-glutamylcyclotransferase family protein [Chloroflexota bacterium]